MLIQILGTGCKKCVALEQATQDAVETLGIDATIEKVTEYPSIAAFGIMSTPGLVVDGTVVSEGRVLTTDQITELLQP